MPIPLSLILIFTVSESVTSVEIVIVGLRLYSCCLSRIVSRASIPLISKFINT